MKAVVLVGGEGTRLRPLTETIPKPLVPFMNRPFLDHVLDHLARHGIEEVICSSPHMESGFKGFLDNRRDAPRITWITEEDPLGTCGAVVGALEHTGDTFLVLNGDVLTDLDLGALVAFHRRRGAVATIALTPVDDARPFGLVETGPDARVLAFREKPATAVPGTINAGTYVLEARALEGVPRGVTVSIERETFPDLIARGEPVFGFPSDSYWQDLGTPQAYLQAHVDALEGRIGGRTYPRPLVGEGSVVDPSASVGGLTVLGPACVVESGARVDRSVLHRGARVGSGAEVAGSILGPGSAVGGGCVVRDAVLAADARVEPGARLEGAGVGPGQVAAG